MMVKCKNCGAVLEDDELFCHECGTKQEFEETGAGNQADEPIASEAKFCIYCGEEIESDSMFCPYCGKSQDVDEVKAEESQQEPSLDISKQESSKEDIQHLEEKTVYENEEEEWKSMSWLWVLLTILIAGVIGGCYYFQSQKGGELSNYLVAMDSDSVATFNSKYDTHSVEGVKERLNEIMSKGLNMQESDAVKKYYSKEFNELYIKVGEIDNRSSAEIGFWEGNLWDGSQEGITGFKINKVYNLSDKTVEADISTIYDYGEHHSEYVQHYVLVFENNNWYIDENLTWEFKKHMKDYISDENVFIMALGDNAVGEDKTCEYFLYDITEDGIPELWIVAGTCEADRELIVYTHEFKEIFRKSADHSTFYRGNDYVLQQCAHMGYAAWMKIYRDGDKIREKKIFEEDTNKTETDYTEPTEEIITLIPYDNTAPIHSVFSNR